MVATHGAAHSQEFEIECLVPKLEIKVFGTGGSRRAGEQAAAKLALEAVQAALVKTPSAARKPRPRTAQLKLAGIATIQSDPAAEGASPVPAKAAKNEKISEKNSEKHSDKMLKQATAPAAADAPKPHGKTEPKSEPRIDHKQEAKPETGPDAAPAAAQINTSTNASKSKSA